MHTHETIVSVLKTEERAVIPTTFVHLAPDKIVLEAKIDILFGLFHIMWKDMPRPRCYRVKLSELVNGKGLYLGCFLQYATKVLKC
ncbi:MAG: hypothetical protein JRN20_22550 [Nitrososphaerota archaeon]|nr:hypothetical protein [Nitrososphaerota archaeon]